MTFFRLSQFGILLACLVLTNLALTNPALAHANHADMEAIDQATAVNTARGVIAMLIGQKKLDSSWESAEPGKVEKRDRGEGKLWIVEHINKKEKDSAKQKLYIFLDESGNPLGANHSGT